MWLPIVALSLAFSSDEKAGRSALAGWSRFQSAEEHRRTRQSLPASSKIASVKSAHEQVPSLVQCQIPN
jgi:hypothetical protein